MSLTAAADLFIHPGLIQTLGIVPVDLAPGRAEARFAVQAGHGQHHGFVHAGAAATLADHTAGAASTSLLQPGQAVLTVEFKINLLKPLVGRELTAKAEVVRAGRQIHVVEVRLYVTDPAATEPVAIALVTLCVVKDPGTSA